MTSTADFKTVAEFYGNFTNPNPSFSHLLFSHRQQRFMLLKMIELVEAGSTPNLSENELASFRDQFEQYDVLFNVHSEAEDEVLMPSLINKSPQALRTKFTELKATLDAQHSEVEKAVKDLSSYISASSVDRSTLLEKLISFGRQYNEHTQFEENQVIATAFALPAETAKEIAKEVGGFFRNAEGVKHSLYAMQEIAYLNNRDYEIWCNSLPWIVRNVVMKMIGLSGEVARYCQAFGTPKDGFDQELAKKLKY